MFYWNCHHGGQINTTHSIFYYFVVCVTFHPIRWRYCLLQFCCICLCRRCHVHSCRESPFVNGWVGRNPLERSRLPLRREEQAGVERPGRRQLIPTTEAMKRKYGISWTMILQPPSTDLHPPTSSDRDREAKSESEADHISLPATAAVPLQYFRWG